MRFLLALILPLYAIDQATKWWIVGNFDYGDERMVIGDFFHLCRWHNTGAAFSMGTGNNNFFVAISMIAFVVVLLAWKKGVFIDRWSRWGVPLLLAGILGNLTDRLIHGYVVDMLLFNLHVRFANPWPAFNVADMCIFFAAACFIIGSFTQEQKSPRPAA